MGINRNDVNGNGYKGLTWTDLRNAILFAAAVYVLLEFIGYVVGTLLIFTITALVVTTLIPIIDWLDRHRVPRAVATLGLILLLVGLVGGGVWYVSPLVTEQISSFVAMIPAIATDISDFISRYRGRLGLDDGFGSIDFQTIWNVVTPYLGGIGQITGSVIYAIGGLIVIVVSSVYLLISPEPIKCGFLKAWRPRHRERVAAATARLALLIRSWALGLVIGMILVFAMTWIGLELIGLPNALLFALVAGILELLPIFGPILSAVVPTLAALVIDPVMAIWVVLAFVIIQQVEGNVLMPLVMARQVRVHPVTVTFWVLVMGGLYGLLGAALAVPAAVTAGVLYDEFYLCEIEQRCKETEVEETAELRGIEKEARQEARETNENMNGQDSGDHQRGADGHA